MLKLNCPSCGGQVEFHSTYSVYAVCSYCKSAVVRQDSNLENLGKVAEVPDDFSPFQIGTYGKFEGQSFTIVGRVVVSWSEGSWSEWFLSKGDGKDYWLADAGEDLIVNIPVEVPEAVPTANQVTLGGVYTLNGIDFRVTDIKQVEVVAAEGELPFKAHPGRKAVSVDLRSEAGEFACMDFSDEGLAIYQGKYIDLSELNPKNLNAFEGW